MTKAQPRTDASSEDKVPRIGERKRVKTGARATKAPTHSVAIGPGNTYNLGGSFRRLTAQYQPLGYMLPWEVLDTVELLSTYNADFSQAVDNIRTLANSGHELFVTAGSALAARQAKAYLETFARTVQEQHGGIDGVIDKLMDQAAVYGAMCGEWLLSEDLTQVVDFADINPKDIRYMWDEDLEKFTPWQKVSASQAEQARKRGQEERGGHIRLNPATFHYYAFDAESNSPYGTPPFVAALEPLGIQRDMIVNMSQIVKKIGLLGIVDLVVEKLPPLPGETDEEYTSRCVDYLDSYVDAAEDMVKDGGLVHFDDVEVKTTNLGGNAAGATNIFKQNEEQVFSGLKSMPSVQGRSYSTTETYAGVAYDIIVRNTQKYQRGAKRMIEAGYWLAVQLAGIRAESITINFHQNKTLNRMQDAQSEALEIANAAKLWKAGIIDQNGFAQLLGYSTVVKKLEEVPDELVTGKSDLNTNNTGASDGGGKPNNGNDSKAQAALVDEPAL